MKIAVRQIDRALKRLYNIDTPYRAESFLLSNPIHRPVPKVANSDFQGALYIQGSVSSLDDEADINVGIFFNDGIKKQLKNFHQWEKHWTPDQLRAFTVAAEEISHFHYFLFNAKRKRAISQFELEMQGEIDKFLLTYFAQLVGTTHLRKRFDGLFEHLFHCFRLGGHLKLHERERYLDANTFAKKFIVRIRKDLENHYRMESALKEVRKFYRMDLAEKMGFLHLR